MDESKLYVRANGRHATLDLLAAYSYSYVLNRWRLAYGHCVGFTLTRTLRRCSTAQVPRRRRSGPRTAGTAESARGRRGHRRGSDCHSRACGTPRGTRRTPRQSCGSAARPAACLPWPTLSRSTERGLCTRAGRQKCEVSAQSRGERALHCPPNHLKKNQQTGACVRPRPSRPPPHRAPSPARRLRRLRRALPATRGRAIGARRAPRGGPGL